MQVSPHNAPVTLAEILQAERGRGDKLRDLFKAANREKRRLAKLLHEREEQADELEVLLRVAHRKLAEWPDSRHAGGGYE